jgi:hypothetical protein
MHVTGLEFAAWATSFAGFIFVLCVVVARRRAREFPFLTLFLAEAILSSAVLFFVLEHFSGRAYRHSAWSLGVVNEIVQLLVVYELAVHVFRPTGVWARDVRRTLIQVACISAVLAGVLARLAQPATNYPIQTFILRSNFFSAALMSELFVGMVVLSGTFGLPWKTHVARIAQGFGAYSIFCVGLDIALIFGGLNHGSATFRSLTDLRFPVFLICELYWIVMLWAQAPAPRELPESMRVQIYTLQRQVENDVRRLRLWRKN